MIGTHWAEGQRIIYGGTPYKVVAALPSRNNYGGGATRLWLKVEPK